MTSKPLVLKSGKLLVPLARHLDNGYTEIEGRTYSPYEIRMLREWLNESASPEPEHALKAWATELHRQLEKLWYTPEGQPYTDDEGEKVIQVLGPTDDAIPADFDRAAYWFDRYVTAPTKSEVAHAVTCKLFPDPHDEREPKGPCTCGAIPPGETGVAPVYGCQHSQTSEPCPKCAP